MNQVSDRVVALRSTITTELGDDFVYGSGCLVSANHVLTSAHVVDRTATTLVRLSTGESIRASIKLCGDPVSSDNVTAQPDLALLELEHRPLSIEQLDSIPLARIVYSSAPDIIEGACAIGYPAWSERSVAETVWRIQESVWGQIPLNRREDGLLELHVRVGSERLDWHSISGAPVFVSSRLVGVICEQTVGSGSLHFTVVPIAAIDGGFSPLLHEGVANPERWWRILGAQSASTLVGLPSPASGKLAEPPYLATLREYGRALHQRMPQLTGRNEELEFLTKFLLNEGNGYCVVSGGPFSGKSALAYELCTTMLPQSVDVVSYFLNRRGSDADSARFLAAVIPQLAASLAIDVESLSVDRYRQLWELAEERAAADGRTLLLLVDGLDEDLAPKGLPTVAALLPFEIGRSSRVIVTNRSSHNFAPSIPAAHPLRQCETVVLEPFEGATGLADLARSEIDALIDDTSALATEVVGLMSAAQGPITSQDLAALHTFPVPPRSMDRHQIEGVLRLAGRSIEPVGESGVPRYRFTHDTLAAHARDRLQYSYQEYRARIGAWARAWRDKGWPMPNATQMGTPLYLLDAYPVTLQYDESLLSDWLDVRRDLGWINAAVQARGVDSTLGVLRSSSAAIADTQVPWSDLVLASTAPDLRSPTPEDDEFVIRHLLFHAMTHGVAEAADQAFSVSKGFGGPVLMPVSTSVRETEPSVELGSHSGGVSAVRPCSDGEVVSVGEDGLVRLWSLARPGIPRAVGSVDSVIWDASTDRVGGIWSVSGSGTISHWDSTGGSLVGQRHAAIPACDKHLVLADGTVVVGCQDLYLRMYRFENPALPATLGKSRGHIWGMAFMGSEQLVTGDTAGDLRLWSLRGGPSVLIGALPGPIGCIAALADGLLVVAESAGPITLWDLERPGRAISTLGSHGGPVWSMVSTEDGKVITGGSDGRICIWDLTEEASPLSLSAHDGPVRSLGLMGATGVISAGSDGRVRYWDRFQWLRRPDELRPIWCACLLPSGGIVTGGFDGSVGLWDENQDFPTALGQHSTWVWDVAAISNDHVITVSQDGQVAMWDVRTSLSSHVLGSHTGPAWAVVSDGLGGAITCGQDCLIYHWSPEHPGGHVTIGHTDSVAGTICVCPDGVVFAGCEDGSILAWPAPGDQAETVGDHGAPVWATAALSNGDIVSGGKDGRIVWWHRGLVSWEGIEIGSHNEPVRTLASLSNGLVVSGGADRAIRFWSIEKPGKMLREVRASARSIECRIETSGVGWLLICHDTGWSRWRVDLGRLVQ